MPTTVHDALAGVRSQHQHLLVTLITGLLVGEARSFSVEEPIRSALSAALFVAGVFLAHFIFLIDSQLKQAAHHRLPLGEASSAPIVDSSPLRQGIVILLLPVLALFLISSTRAALGLGFFWGLSSVYWWEMMDYFRGQAARIQTTYFHQFPAGSPTVNFLVGAYLLYGLLLTAGLLVVRGTP